MYLRVVLIDGSECSVPFVVSFRPVSPFCNVPVLCSFKLKTNVSPNNQTNSYRFLFFLIIIITQLVSFHKIW